jgi:hypothetical protein
MNDTLRALAEARPSRLTPAAPPADPVILMSYPRRSAPRRGAPRRLVLAGAGLIAIAAVTAAVALHPTADTGPAPAPAANGPTPTAGSGSAEAGAPTTGNILLMAANRADTTLIQPARYWVLRRTNGNERQAVIDEQWLATRPDDPSTAYVRPPSGPWSVRPLEGHTSENNFLLAGRTFGVAELAALPTDPDALKAKLLTWHEQESETWFLFFSGAALVMELPVPAAVRAAAYRMLAALPGIVTLGQGTDALGRTGIAVAYSRRGDGGHIGEQRLIVDPATGRALTQESWTDGKRVSYTAVLKAEFADGPLPAAASLN